jgi:hypothetical protein
MYRRHVEEQVRAQGPLDADVIQRCTANMIHKVACIGAHKRIHHQPLVNRTAPAEMYERHVEE